MPKFMMEKLVRDEVLHRCLEDPKVRTEYRTLEREEFIRELIRKVHEEVDEVPVRDESDDEVLEEIADLQEAVDALKAVYQLTDEAVKQAQADKYARDGGFALRAYIVSVDLDEDSEWVERFRRRPEKFREVV